MRQHPGQSRPAGPEAKRRWRGDVDRGRTGGCVSVAGEVCASGSSVTVLPREVHVELVVSASAVFGRFIVLALRFAERRGASLAGFDARRINKNNKIINLL